MYSDLIDSTKATRYNQESLIKAEGFLYKALINGHKPTLTMPQAIDSSIILSLTENESQGEYFLNMIREGYIRLSIFGDVSSLQGYILRILRNNLDADSPNFVFSSIPFLNDGKYSEKRKAAIYKGLLTQLEEGNLHFQSDIIDSLDKEFLDNYVNTIRRLNSASLYSYIPSGTPAIKLHEHLRARIDDVLYNENSSEELKALLNVLKVNCTKDFRTYYYEILEKNTSNYSSGALEEAKELIDYCYNEVVASSIKDKDLANLNIPNSCQSLVTSALDFDTTTSATNNKIELQDKAKEKLTWETIGQLVKEIENPQVTKGISWNDAILEYKSKQRLSSFISIGKYLTISAVTYAISSCALPNDPHLNFAASLMMNEFVGRIENKLRKPQSNDLLQSINQGFKINKLFSTSDTSINAKKLNR